GTLNELILLTWPDVRLYGSNTVIISGWKDTGVLPRQLRVVDDFNASFFERLLMSLSKRSHGRRFCIAHPRDTTHQELDDESR
ncbi:MAG: hypothetical protein ACREX0_09860, partial [Noviherbaspirillum sp.]